MNKSITQELIESYEIELIEKNLVYSFLQNNNLEATKSPIISELLTHFKVAWLSLILQREKRILEKAFFA